MIANLQPVPLAFLKACPIARVNSAPLVTFALAAPTVSGSRVPSRLGVMIDLLVLCFQGVTNPSSSNSFCFTSIQNPRGSGVHQVTFPPGLAVFTPNHFLSHSCKLFVATKTFNSLAISEIQSLSAKHPGYGYLRPFRGTPLMRAYGSLLPRAIQFALRLACSTLSSGLVQKSDCTSTLMELQRLWINA